MAAAAILAFGNTEAFSPQDLILAAGEQATVCLRDADASAHVQISLKNDAGTYTYVGEFLNTYRLYAVLSAPGTYRFTRTAGACGVFRG